MQDGIHNRKGVSVISLFSNLQCCHQPHPKNCSTNNALHPSLYSLLISVSTVFPSSHDGKNASKPLEDGFGPVVSVFVLHRQIIIIVPSSPGIINHSFQIDRSYRCGEAGSDAGRCTVQDCTVYGPAFWGERVDRLGPSSGCKLH